MSSVASHRHRLAQIVVNCDAGNTCVCFANQIPPTGEKRTDLILGRNFFLTEETAPSRGDEKEKEPEIH